MAEIIFILVIIYFVYVVNTTIERAQEKKKQANTPTPIAPATKSSNSNKTEVKEEKTVVNTESKSKPKTKPTTKKVSTKKHNMPTGELRNPATGQTDKIATNYRMLRRWIKDALVKEGLLEKIYKTNELDEKTQVKIIKALNKIKKIDKYQ